MKRDFTSKEAKQLAAAVKNKLNVIDEYISVLPQYVEGIKESVNTYINIEAVKILNNTPIDELSRKKGGIRVKTLKDEGINSIGDIFRVSEAKLEDIKGISGEGAKQIKNLANEFLHSTKKEVKVRLSLDNITNVSSKLVVAVSRYRDYLEFVSQCKKIKRTYKNDLETLIGEIEAGQNTVKWIFSSRDKKDKIIESYDKLYSINSGDFGKSVQKLEYEDDKIKKKTIEASWDDFSLNNIKFINIIEEFCPGVLGTNDVLYGLPEELAKEILLEPIVLDGFNGTLRKYQELGVKYILHQKRVLLGDEMGLGKTIQAIATMVSLYNTNKAKYFIVVCPASVVINWCREVQKFSPLKAYLIHGEDKIKNIKDWGRNGGVAVVNYESIQFLNEIKITSYNMLIVDEAHFAKNPDAKRTENVKKLCRKTNRVLFMTGTALENRVDEMVNLINMLNMDVAETVNKLAFMSTAEEFRMKVASVYYRRKKDDVLTELPELVETKEWCSLNSEEEKVYEESVLSRQMMKARRVSWNVNLENSSKAARLKEIVEEAEEEGRKVILFSFFLDTINKIKEFLGSRCSEPINGQVSLVDRQRIIDEFSESKTESVLLCQIQAGGTGLNIQCASVIIIAEPQYKPSIENQAIARAYRMGQSRNVLVYRLLCEDTVDERISEILEEKSKIFDAFADDSVAAMSCEGLDSAQVSKILDEEVKRINEKHGDVKKEENTIKQ